MGNPSHKVQTIEVYLAPSSLGIPGRISFAAMLAQVAPQSAIYTGNAPVKTAIDALVKAGASLAAATTAKETARQAYFTAIGVEVAAQTAYDLAAGVVRGTLPLFCKTAQDLESLGCSRRIKSASVPLIPPVLVIVRPDKDPGSIYTHAHRIPGLFKYILAVSVDPITPTSWEEQTGSTATRHLSGLVSGKLYWLRWCTERGTKRSAWSAPISVTAK
jgi:hypothetical protein